MRRRHRWARFAGPIGIATIVVVAIGSAGAAPVPGSQGTDTSLPATPSQVTVGGRGKFADLQVTVNQTADLTNQAVSITWTGAEPTLSGPGRFASRYLQIMQCWGDDDGTAPGNPGPPPEQCQQGALGGTPAGAPGSLWPSPFAVSRIISASDWANFDPTAGFVDTRTNYLWKPFRAVDGTVVNVEFDPKFNPVASGGNYWLNPYFNNVTTNEIGGSPTGPDGRGAELFEVATGLQATGLGCGQKTQPVVGADKKIPQCWIVIVPRGAPADENAGTPSEVNADQFGVITSPLSPAAWQNRIAIPIDFKPIDSPCSLSSVERRLAGTELVLPAVSSWQPVLCAGGTLPPYSYATVGDASARQLLVNKPAGAPGMVVVSRPLSAADADASNPAVYAPLALSGLVVGYNIERNVTPTAPAEQQQIAGSRVAQLNLTPRLVAKLLTQSYTAEVAIFGRLPTNYAWATTNPQDLNTDPDFLQFNPEFELMYSANPRTLGGLQLPAGTSDAAQQVWEWVLADPEAKAWLDGAPDPWGMKVNPVYATVASANSTGSAFANPAPNSFPKADPYCFQGAARGLNNSVVPPPLCGTDWMPYNRGFNDGAHIVRTAVDGARVVENPFALNSAQVWSREGPQVLGRRSILSITDTPSAEQFGLQMARLSRAGDDGADRNFIAPDAAGLAAGFGTMVTKSDPAVLEPDPTVQAPGAYPLTTLSYAVVKPLNLDQQARSEYAAFLDYAAGPGQVQGFALGQLPQGYASLPDNMRAQTVVAAELVRTLVAVPATNTEPPTTTSTTAPAAPVAPQAPASRPARSNPRPAAATPPTEAPTTTEVTATTEVTTTTEPAAAAATPTTTTTAPPKPAVVTPGAPVAQTRFAVPAMAVLALGSGLGALEVTKRPRRRAIGDIAETPMTELEPG